MKVGGGVTPAQNPDSWWQQPVQDQGIVHVILQLWQGILDGALERSCSAMTCAQGLM